MKLAEALIERADLQKKLEMLRARMMNNSKVQEGTNPNENPKDLIEELDKILERLEFLIVHINKTNELTKIADGKTISELIAKRDVLTKKISLLGSLHDSGSQIVNRLTRTEIKILPAVNVAELQKNIDSYSKELRLLDTKIQEANWTTELV